MGLSSLLQRGHVVYLPDDEGDTGEKFLHTFHVRSGLIEPPQPDVELIIDPKPEKEGDYQDKSQGYRDEGSYAIKGRTGRDCHQRG